MPNTESSEASSKPSTLDIAKFANKAYYERKDREALKQEISDTFRSFNEQEHRRKIERRKKYIGGFAIAAALVFAGAKTAEAVKTLTTPLAYTVSGERQVAEGDTLWDYAEDIIQDVDMVLLMSVNPGYGGQKFIEHSVEKTRALRDMITRKGLDTLIEIDGGVNLETGKRLLEAGADILVAGSFVFKAPNPEEVIHKLKTL